MPQKPVGTRVIPTAEWFAGNAAMAGAVSRGTNAPSGIEVSLYNDAPLGQYLWVWWFSAAADGEGPYSCTTFEGANGALLTQGSYVMAGRGSAFGQVYTAEIDSLWSDFPPVGSSFAAMGYFDDESAATLIVNGQGPKCVLPPGFSFAIDNPLAGDASSAPLLACTFYYSILPYIPTT
jgi:hypothetical protein